MSISVDVLNATFLQQCHMLMDNRIIPEHESWDDSNKFQHVLKNLAGTALTTVLNSTHIQL